MAEITIDGTAVEYDDQLALAMYRLICAIVRAGATETVTFGGASLPNDTRSFLVTPTTHVSIALPTSIGIRIADNGYLMLMDKYNIQNWRPRD